MFTRIRRTSGFLALCLSLVPLAAPAEESVCVVPGLTQLTDVDGDVQPGTAMGLVPAPLPLDYADLLSLQVAQLPEGKLMFTLTVASLDTLPTLPPSSIWYISFKAPGGLFGVRMLTSQAGAASFESYQVDTGGLEGDGVSDGRFAVAGSEKPADAASAASGGTISIVVSAADVGVQRPGETLSQFNAAQILQINTPAVLFAETFDQMPDDLGRRGSLVLDANNCAGESKLAAKSGSTRFGGGVAGLGLLLPLLFAGLRRRRG